MANQENTGTQEHEVDANEATEAHDEAPAANETAEQKLAKQFDKRKVVIVPSGGDLTALQAFLSSFRPSTDEVTDENKDLDELLDWTNDVEYENPSYLLVQSDTGETRFVAAPSRDVALNDPLVRAEVYNYYLAKMARAAKKDDAAQALFTTPAGFLLGFDKEAFNFQADKWIEFLAKKGAKVNAKRLRQILSSAAYASALYAKVPQDFWKNVINGMIEKAERSGHSAALLQHWLNTRDVTAADMPDFKWDASEVEAVANAPESEPTPVPAPATA